MNEGGEIMSVTFTDEMIEDMVKKYQDGASVTELGKIFGVHYQTISNKLKQLNVFKPKTHNWTDEDTKKLMEVYPTGDWNLISSVFPNRSRESLYCQASKLKIRSDNYFWTEHDKNILINLYYNTDVQYIQTILDHEYTIKQIQNQAKKMGLKKRQPWSEHEIAVLMDKYKSVGAIGVADLLPGRSNRAIIGKAMSLGLRCECYWTEEEVEFLVNNWPKMSDEEIARKLGRGIKGVSDKRRSLGLYFPKNNITYYDIDDFIRHHNYEWKKLSMVNCNYKCLITGGSDFEVHHTYSFNLILKEAMLDDRWISKEINDYTSDELKLLLAIFFEYQSKYPLGVCVSVDYHRKFHSIYGNRANTPEQWNEFLNTYINTSIAS